MLTAEYLSPWPFPTLSDSYQMFCFKTLLCVLARASAPTMAAVPDAISAIKRLVNRELGESIWQRSYHDHVIRNDNDYREIWNYIDTNPAKWPEDCFFTE